MLEIKNISKTYKTKKGLEVKALEDVSLNFGDTGMVFILGKSGSGKSTLLNVLGGLDSYDEGEFIIKGKSSKDFTQADFDSYRNTFIGFIFQEYNILEEFTVGANIALAMQLQGKKADNDTLNKILEEVDLVGYGNRKPNELSGGQKQRVAIARALVKQPEIIMADEPTGALDSNTGRQVFDTLKKLSKDKLVIVVSHDREFAEYYGDRVIELKDGQIISDISKYESAPEAKSDGISIIDGRIMQLKKGYKLSIKDLSLINTYLANAETDALLSLDQRSNESFKQIAMISDEGGKKSFKDTDNAEVGASGVKDGYKIIKSRLPFKHSLKIGASSLKSKPIKLIFTILLSLVSFALFGIADTFAAYDAHTATVSSLFDSKEKHLSIGKYKRYSGVKLSDTEIADMEKETGIKFNPVYSGMNDNYNGGFGIQQNLYISQNNYSNYYVSRLSGLTEMNAQALQNMGMTLTGQMPSNNTQIVVSDFIFDHFAKYGWVDYNDPTDFIEGKNITSHQGFIDRKPTLNIENKIFEITGIFDSGFNADGRYDSYKSGSENPGDYTTYRALESEIKNGTAAIGIVANGVLQSLVKDNFGTTADYHLELSGAAYYLSNRFAKLDQLQVSGKDHIIKGEINKLGYDEIIIEASEFVNIFYNLANSINIQLDSRIPETFQFFMESSTFAEHNALDGTLMDRYGGESIEVTKKIIGVYFNDDNNYDRAAIVSDKMYNDCVSESNDAIYAYALGMMPESRADIEKLVSFLENKLSGTINYKIHSNVTDTLDNFGEMIVMLADIFIYIGLGFALFASLMLMNFIATSISYKKREIGILRAVGARGADVFGIFCNESMIIALINFVLATLATLGACIGINYTFRNELGLPITLLTMGIRQVALIFAVSVLAALIASLLPVLKIARKRPIDAIRNK